MAPLTGRRIVITGASSGIGRSIAEHCVGAGASVACVARGAVPLKALADNIHCTPVVADVADPAQARWAIGEAAGALAGIDGLVNCAGAMLHGSIVDGDYEDWKAMVDVNILGLLLMTSAVVPFMDDAGRGDIVNISSTSAVRVRLPELTVYSATKAAVNMIGTGLRGELSARNIRVTTLMPGLVNGTGMGPAIRDERVRSEVMARRDESQLEVHHVANEVVHIISSPAEVRFNEVTLVDTRQIN